MEVLLSVGGYALNKDVRDGEKTRILDVKITLGRPLDKRAARPDVLIKSPWPDVVLSRSVFSGNSSTVPLRPPQRPFVTAR